MCDHIGRYVNTLFVCHVMSLGCLLFGGRNIRGWSADNRLVWIGMLELTCGRLDGSWIPGTERKHFRIFFPFHASITIGMGVIFLIINRVNKQIIPQTKVWIIKVIIKVWLSTKKPSTHYWIQQINKKLELPTFKESRIYSTSGWFYCTKLSQIWYLILGNIFSGKKMFSIFTISVV